MYPFQIINFILKATYMQSIKGYMNLVLSSELIKVEFSWWDDQKAPFQT